MTQNFHIGLDYGTSTSKIVVRDYYAPGGEKAFILEIAGDHKIPSSVAFDGKCLYFGKSNEFSPSKSITWFHSVKMRIALEILGGEHKYYYGEISKLPNKYDSIDLAILTVWYLLSVSRIFLEGLYQNNDIKLTSTMGIPLKFFDNDRMRNTFLEISRCAHWLYKNIGYKKVGIEMGVIKYEEGLMCSRLAREKNKLEKIIPKESVRQELRTEAEASLYWAFSSPNIPIGRYANIDVGAGTTDSCIFAITEKYSDTARKWIKNKICFFGEHSGAVEMDAIDETLCDYMEKPRSYAVNLRGKEEKTLLNEHKKAREHISEPLEGIYEVLGQAFRNAYSKERSPSAWKKLNVIIMGGGSLISEIRKRMKEHPYVNRLHWDERERFCKIRELEVPEDLSTISGEPLRTRNLPFILTAYGLSLPLGSVPPIDTPSEVEEITPPQFPRRIINHEDLYSE